jgi:DUF1365 family protein
MKASTRSAIYEGWVRHRRFAPRTHAFEMPLFMLYVDLDELPGLFDGHWLWSARRPALGWFRKDDYLPGREGPLADRARDVVEKHLGIRPSGPVRLLTHARIAGYVFNPVSFYYCFDPGETRVEAIVAEITNTPWNERHCYVLRPAVPGDAPGRRGDWYEFDKKFHVSPFMPMEQHYRWYLAPPGENLTVHMENFEAETRLFDATLTLRRRQMCSRVLSSVLLRYPLLTAKVVAGIHWQALRLWLKRIPFHSHPAKRAASPSRAERS